MGEPTLGGLCPRLVAEVVAAGDELWNEFRARRGNTFHPFVPADTQDAARALAALRPTADSFVELGSGVGTITVLAALMGYGAFAIELDPWLCRAGESLATRFDADATFACGTFVPQDYRNPALESSDFLTVTDGADGWDELGCAMDDFDVVYAFPWPDEEALLFDLVRKCAAPHAQMLTFSGTEGFRVFANRGHGPGRFLA